MLFKYSINLQKQHYGLIKLSELSLRTSKKTFTKMIYRLILNAPFHKIALKWLIFQNTLKLVCFALLVVSNICYFYLHFLFRVYQKLNFVCIYVYINCQYKSMSCIRELNQLFAHSSKLTWRLQQTFFIVC